jgi:uncharacterized membrane protein (UPF0182 family)
MSTRDVGVGPGEATVLPPVALPRVPSATVVWTRALILAAAALGLFFLDRIALLLMHFWLLESLGLKSVFWTNFRMGAGLFGVAFVALTAAVAAPAYIHRLATTARKRAIFAGILLGLVGGYVYSGLYQEYLLFFNGISFGETDPVFSHDIGFYVFDVPAIADAINLAVIVAALFLASSLLCAWLGRPENWLPQGMKRLSGVVGVAFTTTSMVGLLTVAALLALRTWFERYYVLIRENADSSIANGAEYLDVNGFFSTVNGYTVSALAILFGLTALAVRLRALHNATTGRRTGADWKKLGIVSLVMTLVPGAAIDSAFRAMVALRNETQVTPNEPVIQYKYIERHVDATRAAFGLDNIEEREFLPNGPGAPPPRVGPLMSDPAIQNAPLWPGYVSWLEELIDPEYAQRVLQTGGDTMIYGPTLEIIPQQQKLRPYYNFMDVDTVRYEVDGEDQLFFTSVRELPLVEPQPWLAWWGQRFLLFTHGHGFVAGPVSRKTTPSATYRWRRAPPSSP